MNASSLIDQLLKTGLGTVAEARGSVQAARERGDLDKYAKGAAAGGLMALLLGTRTGRNLGGKALKVGGVAALGMLAWRAYSDWQANQGQAATPTAAPPMPAALPAPQAEAQGRLLLKAMIAAAKCDGHVDARERGLIDEELTRGGADTAMRDWVLSELNRPVDPADVAAGAQTPETAAQVYLASLLVVDDTVTMERAYLDELARQLRLAPALQADLEARLKAA